MRPPTPKPQPEPLLLGVADTAALLGVSRGTVRNLVADGKLTAVRPGHRILVQRASVERLAAGAASEPAA